MRPEERAQAARRQAMAQEAAYARVRAACDAVNAQIDARGADGLADFCARYAGDGLTTGNAIMGIVLRRLGRDTRDLVREALP